MRWIKAHNLAGRSIAMTPSRVDRRLVIRRRCVSFVLMVGLLFAQAITIAHACPVTGTGASIGVNALAAMPADCPDLAVAGTRDLGAVCVTHCVSDQQADTQLAVLTPAMSDSSPLLVRTETHRPFVAVVTYTQRAVSRAPPPLDLSTRLLV